MLKQQKHELDGSNHPVSKALAAKETYVNQLKNSKAYRELYQTVNNNESTLTFIGIAEEDESSPAFFKMQRDLQELVQIRRPLIKRNVKVERVMPPARKQPYMSNQALKTVEKVLINKRHLVYQDIQNRMDGL